MIDRSEILSTLGLDGSMLERVVPLLEYDPMSPISLVSGFFLVAFLIFGLGYLVVKRWARARTLYVVLFSLYFYYKLSGLYLLLLLFVAVSDFVIGRRVAQRLERGESARGYVALSVVINLAILIYFKATDAFVESVNALYGEGTLQWGKVVVPAGVSFFVFQSIAYVVDIARGHIKPLKHLSDYIFLLSFFPKMFLGPLVRAKDFIPQIEARNISISKADVGRAVTLIAGGVLKYGVVAKALGVLFVSPALAGELGDSGVVALMAIYGFTLQIYCDFSGYSDLAIGVALLLGFRLPDNFDAPYHSATITEFWRRWHISLSTWLKEYLYISLGGNRRGAVRTYLNLILTMLLGGLWHGVGFTFVAWGLWHGVALALHKMWLKVVPGAKTLGRDMRPWWRALAVLFTFHLVAFGWLLFAAESMQQVDEVVLRIAYNSSWADLWPMMGEHTVAMVLMVIGYVMHALPRSVDSAVQRRISSAGVVTQAIIIVAAVWLMVQCNMMLAAASGDGANLPMYAAF